MEQEIWKTAQYIFENGHKEVFEKYQVSNLGRVKSLDYHLTGKAKVMRPHTWEDKDGSICYTIMLRKNNKKHCVKVHRLVLSSFDQEGWDHAAVVDHIVARTSTSCDNRLSNLRWYSQKENTNTEHFKELISRASSKRVKVTDMSNGEVTEYPSAKEADMSLCVPLGTASHAIRSHKGFYKKLNLHFEYL